MSYNIETDPQSSWHIGRNGCAPIKEISITASYDNKAVMLEGVNRRGRLLNGGMRITSEAMDELCQKWLVSRGKGGKGLFEDMDGGGNHIVLTVCKEDIAKQRNISTDELDEVDMASFAEEMNTDCLMESFWSTLDYVADYLNLPENTLPEGMTPSGETK